MAFCKHEWVDVTLLGSVQRSLMCGRCGQQKSEPLSSFQPIYRSFGGVEMRQVQLGGGNGSPNMGTITQNRTEGTKVEYGCGCVWDVNESTLRMAFGARVERSCPTHRSVQMQGVGPYDPSGAYPQVGYAQGGAVQGGSLNISLSSVNPYYAPYPSSQPEPPRELELTFQTEPIVGWRVWRVVEHHLHGGIVEPRLQPLTGRNLWEPRVRYEAQCLPPANRYAYGSHAGATHEAPHRDCECGTWAVRDRQDLPTGHPHGLVAIGEVHLWGRVLEFKKGWRAKYAYPKSLTLLADDQAMADDLARLYGVEVALNPPAKPRALFKQTAGEWMAELLMSYGRGPTSIVQGTEP